jgi:hypothetical protein
VSPLVKQVDRLALAVADSKKKETYLLRRLAELELKYEVFERGRTPKKDRTQAQGRLVRSNSAELMAMLQETMTEQNDETEEVSPEDISNFISFHLKGAECEYSKIFEQSDKDRHWLDAFIYASCSGCIGACSVLLAGMTAKTIIMAVQGGNQFDTVWPYLFIFGMIVTIISQTDLLNCALQVLQLFLLHQSINSYLPHALFSQLALVLLFRFLQCGDVMQVFPIFQAFFIGFGTIGGMIFYQQSWVLTEKEGHAPGWVIYAISARFVRSRP